MNMGRIRGIGAVLCIVLAATALAASMPSLWIRNTLASPERFQAIVGRLPSDPAVREVVAREITDEVFEALDVDERLHDAIAERVPALAFVSGSLTDGMRDFVNDQVDKVLASEQFDKLWNEAVLRLHTRVMQVLSGESEVVSIQGDQIVLDLTPIINSVLQRIEGLAGDLLGRTIDIPEATGTAMPGVIKDQIESALGITLPEDFGNIVVYESTGVGALSDTLERAHRFMVLIIASFVLGVIGALALSTHRRRTLMQMTGAFFVVGVIERRLAMAGVDALVGEAKAENRAAVQSIADDILAGFLQSTVVLLSIFALLFLVAVFLGPYRWAVAIRHGIVRFFSSTLHMKGALNSGRRAIGRHRDAVRIGVAIVGVLLLLFSDLSILWSLIVIGVAAAVVIVVSTTPPDTSRDWI